MPLPEATLHGSAEIAVPTLVSTLAIACVFTSVVFLEGPARYLFTPLALAVVFAMLASYGLSRTLTPITIGLLLKGEHGAEEGAPRGFFGRFHAAFERGFERMRTSYAALLAPARRSPAYRAVRRGAGAGPRAPPCSSSSGATSIPNIDGGRIQLHVRAPAGTRIETTERIFQAVEDKIREVIPDHDRELIVDNIGLPARAYNLAFTDGSTIGVNDGVIMVALKEGHAPTADYVRKLREVLPAAFPDVTFYFQAADIVTQILNFGLPAQIDVRTIGYDNANNLRVAKELRGASPPSPASPMRICSRRRTRPRSSPDIDRIAGSAARAQRQFDRRQHQRQPQLLGAGVAKLLDRPRFRPARTTSPCRRPSTRSARSTISATRRSRPASRPRAIRCRGCSATWRR